LDYEKSCGTEGSSRAHQQKDCANPFAAFSIKTEQLPTSDITYEIVEHDDGWAYRVNGVFSEAFPSHAEALAAA